MKKTSGVLRRVALLVAVAWAYSHFVISGSLYTWSPETREWLAWLLYGAVTWGVITLFADRLGRKTNPREEPDNASRNNEPRDE